MSATDAIMAEEDGTASKKLLSNDAQGCLIDAKPPESIKHLIAVKEEASTLRFVQQKFCQNNMTHFWKSDHL